MFLPSLNTSTEHTLTFTPCLLEVKLQDKTRNMNEGVITLKKTPILAWLVCNDPSVFAQIRLLFSMIDRFVPVFSCPGLDEAGVGCKTQSSH